ncbi:hypothetical protein [Sinomonas sp. R1AF57]|uniref:hypothetical protein n=1 Tax=Sinomonas sp. R1AF57 TaxID=2020377 RepID=UPI000B620CEC|nr:hypothetical protein [Sinomonas sp. R1AF57]ASN50865.1 hypothetical protein CGQ25_01170 [Sinomonas sp. R1AF57]
MTQVEAVLAEEGLEHDAELRRALAQLPSLRPAVAPGLSPELAAVFSRAAGAPRADVPVTAQLAVVPSAAVIQLSRAEARRAEAAAASAARPRWRRRGAVIGAVVVAGMGLGVSGVAALSSQGWEAWPSGFAHVLPSESATQDTNPETPEAPAHSDAAAVQPAQPESPAAKSAADPGAAQSSPGAGPQDANAQGGDQTRPKGGAGSSGTQGSQGGNSQGGNSQGGTGQGGSGQTGHQGNSQGSNR